MYDFNDIENDYSLPHDIGGQAALNDFNRSLFNAVQSLPGEDALWEQLRGSELGQHIHQLIMDFDEYEFNGSALEGDE